MWPWRRALLRPMVLAPRQTAPAGPGTPKRHTARRAVAGLLLWPSRRMHRVAGRHRRRGHRSHRAHGLRRRLAARRIRRREVVVRGVAPGRGRHLRVRRLGHAAHPAGAGRTRGRLRLRRRGQSPDARRRWSRRWSAVPFAGNRLALVVPASNPAGIASPFDLGRPGVRLVAAGVAVPITAYAAQMVGVLAGLPDAPRDFAAAVEANMVSREDNVRAVLAKVELGEGDAAIVYATDATAAGDAVGPDPAPRRGARAGDLRGGRAAGRAEPTCRGTLRRLAGGRGGPGRAGPFRVHGSGAMTTTLGPDRGTLAAARPGAPTPR